MELLENMYSNEEGKKEKEGGMNSIVFNAASFNNIQFPHFFKVVKITIHVHRNLDKHRNQTFSMRQC